ncbi:YolD-like family protein [Paenactinomyces guangxiensis]|uniref:YolD-like family protein n=1 Tax=Paenactinomyces guangxiensis TaxID=1490290 RepID=A0A7W1WMS9_9BACL|nr:YolD-like family protein [Paenactinomyces guangxiensis]MBA4492772.1 YolD-like family protein [Paenactinomyces guangxiensis]MBH8590379.1 YolD-like family protein [Paenactinomyces guangxiensis]
MSDIPDRKNMLWEGSRMFLPEHREALLKQRRRAEEFTPPELDESQLEYMNYILREALEEEKPVLVTYAAKYSREQFCGFVDKVDPYSRVIRLSNGDCKKQIPFAKLLHVEWP